MSRMQTWRGGATPRRDRRRPSIVVAACAPVAMVATVAGTLALLAAPAAATGPALPRPEVPVTATNLVEKVANTSPLIAVDPTQQRFMAIAHRVDGPDFSCGLAVSGDGGRGWIPAYPALKLPKGAEKCYAPEVAFDARGNLYYLFVGLAGAGNSPMGAFLTMSTDKGATFSPPRMVLGPERYMVRMAIDRALGARGRIHLVWVEARSDPPLGGMPAPPNPIMAAHSDDGGATFSRPVQVNDPGRPLSVAPAVAIGTDHAVHVLYYDLGTDLRDYQGLEGPTWEGTWSLVLATSSDGGAHFTRTTLVDDGIVPPERVMLVFTMPPASLVAGRAGHLYAAWTDARSGDWDVLMRASADGGATWGKATRVNDDPRADHLNQFLPRLSVAPDGRLDAVFYDRRGNVENRGNDVYYTYSTDDATTFAPNVKLTAVDSDSLVGYQYGVVSARDLHEWGSRLGLVSLPGRAVAAWTDARNSGRSLLAQDIFAAEVDLGGDPGTGRSWISIASVAVALGGLILAGATRIRRRREAAA